MSMATENLAAMTTIGGAFLGGKGGRNMSLRMGKCLKIGPARSGRGLGCWRYREENRNVVMTLEREMV